MRVSLYILIAFSLLACSEPQTSTEPSSADPEAATGFIEHGVVVADNYMVVAANPHAAEAGANILSAGGSAIDAAVAVQAMLTLVEPQSSGIGGGAFMLYYHAEEQKLYALDARETAPSEATPELFLNENGEPPSWIDAVVGGRSVGAPGVVRGLEMAHQSFGALPWNTLFEDAIELAEQGFEVSPRLAKLVAMEMNPGLKRMPVAADYFYPNGVPLAEGDLLINQALANSLSLIAEQGADGFYTGELAEEIVHAVQNSPIAPGLLNLSDLANYQAKWREPVCGPYREYQVCSMGLPSSGGITMLQTLGMLNTFDMGAMDIEEGLHYFTQASRLAFADRNLYLADGDFVDVPVEGMLNAEYLEQRAQLIGDSDIGKAQPGTPVDAPVYANAVMMEQPNTSHFSIVDAAGNVVSMTTSIEMGFGSTVMAGGFLLNNQLTDFSIVPERNGVPVANRVEAGKRPRSSMTPVIMFGVDQQPVYALGSPGGQRIINYVTQVILGLSDWDKSLQQAIEMPHITNLNGSTAVEEDLAPQSWLRALQERGHDVQVRGLNSGIHGIYLRPDQRLESGVDPRREGKAIGL
ncbi:MULTISPECIES: gamma-glutamyltransferase [Gammaproteobacteria]|uniref:gamma-glutamyltransferase n=1 Tax=Gammaproteobacteria TaxID=1236 RepID=UPI000DD03DA2|nr:MULTISPECIES: gamma-glutamyltransferase [Gammaproteobacteria]RTE87151.1 gamma-glutamyltransferase [Aliidiomarina sp. B3213]TCZ93061.1 gamma-glutamyltransferase [Lysobacter sp. N42]